MAQASFFKTEASLLCCRIAHLAPEPARLCWAGRQGQGQGRLVAQGLGAWASVEGIGMGQEGGEVSQVQGRGGQSRGWLEKASVVLEARPC